MRNEYLKLSHNITEFLYNNQIKISPFKILEGVTNKKIIFNQKHKFEIQFILQGNQLFYVINNQKRGPFHENEMIRINPYQAVDEKKIENFSKLKLIKKVYSISKNLIKKSITGTSLEKKALLKDYIKKIKRENLDIKEGGCIFYFILQNKEAIINCFDNGGIFDDNPNAEGLNLSPRVMGNYYADAYSAYCFIRRYQETRNKKYLEGGLKALDFMIKTYENYPKSNIWYHHDFKNPAFIETILLLKNQGFNTIKYETFINKLREDFYQPTNVFALRFYWRSLKEVWTKEKDKKIKIVQEILKKSQTKEGLIRDINEDDYKEAYDLTYHLYSLACLAGGLKINNDPKVKEIFLKGCNFSKTMLLPNGEISYSGRGANNIYHIASAIFAFEFASNRYYFKKEGTTEMIKYLSRWKNRDQSLSTAMNNYPKERMSWNHCRTPYNALTAFLLYQASDEYKKKPNNMGKKCILNKESRYFIFTNENYYFSFFSGSKESYSLSEGCHKVGVAGCANLGFNKRLSGYLILDRALKENRIISDIPHFKYKNKIIEPIDRFNINKEKDSIIIFKKEKGVNFQREYIFKRDKIKINTKIESNKEIICEDLVKIPLSIDNGWKIEIEKDKIIQSNKNKKIIFTNFSPEIQGTKIDEIASNPRGKGKLIRKGHFNGKKISYEYEIHFE